MNMNMQDEVTRLAKNIAAHEESELLKQMSELLRNGLIVVEKQEPVIVRERTEIGYMLKILPKVNLVLKDKEYIGDLKKENKELKDKLRVVSQILGAHGIG